MNVDGNRLNRQLNVYFAQYVKVKLDSKKNVVRETIPIVRELVKEVGRCDRRFSRQFRLVGSYVHNLKNVFPDEFDVNIPLHLDKSLFEEVRSCNLDLIANNDWGESIFSWLGRAIGLIKYRRFAGEIFKISPLDNTAPEGFVFIKQLSESNKYSDWVFNRYLVPRLVKKTFYHLLHDAVHTLGYADIVEMPDFGGPVVSVKILVGGRKIDVDFSPSLERFSPFRTPWPKIFIINRWLGNFWPSESKIDSVRSEETDRIPKKDLCWWVSYARADTELLQGMDEDAGCRKQCLRMMKQIRTDIWCPSPKPVITSYHIKNAVWWECFEYPRSSDWSRDMLSTRFKSTVKRLCEFVEDARLPLFFDSDVNLFQETDREKLRHMKQAIDDFLQNPMQALVNYSQARKIEDTLRRPQGLIFQTESVGLTTTSLSDWFSDPYLFSEYH